ncbi:Mur ligase family protein [Thiorhodovibrio frisius]|uniref:UDP-N-acetylmuramyl pentapeptide synthase n=1 Tax=Thiorhodovibrio frisius TaxID=631362 RepID=H8YYB2_9GAMM|nr:Mur ligase family protein [Thiorhodovibrio frisius]EIC23438.1 UDP-N-acetylmuramyl pentapeptide synthase [Thiorhodovibrio frisius]WPL23481.1 Phosphocholine transferase AnkX [Thiorhodovibrio frisius]
MSSIKALKQFDRSQLWRLFVDGRFHKKYGGWVGYEAGERGSVRAWLSAFAYMLDHFDLSSGLKGTYLRELHKRAMLGVQTTNIKSSPGDIRYLNSGIPFFASSTTYEHLVEVFAMRRGDGTAMFNNRRFAKPADELSLDDVWAALLKEGRLNYRNWYPNLDLRQQEAINGRHSLQEFYSAKHSVQMLMVAKMEEILARYNRDIRRARNDEEKLATIALVPRELELLHPFPDGNSRTFSCVTLTHLLLWHGFSPTLLENPNLDNEVSHAQWVGEVKKGMARFKALSANPDMRVFDFSIQDMASGDRKRFLEMASEVNRCLDNHREIYLTPERLADFTSGRWLMDSCDPNLRFTGVGTYGTHRPGNLYFALALGDWRTDKKDPRCELAAILSKGMRALVIDDMRYATGWPVPVLLVDDITAAFKNCAIQVRQQKNPTTVLVTGTEGKTGAKVQFHHLLSKQVQTHAVLNSANTEVPVLRSLIELSEEDKVEINEVSVGSDEALRVERARMVNPDLCFITNVGPNHMDMHKTLDNIFIAKSSVVEGLRDGGKCIVNADIHHFPKLIAQIDRRRPGTPILTYGTSELNNGVLLTQTFVPERFGWNVRARINGEELSYFLPLFQQHAPLGSVGILLAIQYLGHDIQRAARDYAGLIPFETMGRILEFPKRSGKVLFYDQSRRGAIKGMRSAFADMKNFRIDGRIVALVGGISTKKDSDWTREAHTELAQLINDSRIARLYTTGNYMDYVTERLKDPSIFVRHCDDLDALAQNLFNEVRGGDLLFIIGNAYLYLGRVSERLLALKDESRFDPAIVDQSLSQETFEFYQGLVTQAEVDRGLSLEQALYQTGLPEHSFAAFQALYPTFEQACGFMLFDFFAQIDKALTNQWSLVNVNEAMKTGGFESYVYSKDYCSRWFANFTKQSNLKKKQLFGSFYDYGNEAYLLHIEVATTNLHLGFVSWRQNDENEEAGRTLVRMTAAERSSAAQRFTALTDLTFRFLPRDWGLGWISYDCGAWIDPINTKNFCRLRDPLNNDFYTQTLEPLLKKLVATVANKPSS